VTLHFDYLCDETKLFVHLVDCELRNEKLSCGFCWFRGGISGAIDMFDGETRVTAIEVPKEVGQNATFVTLFDADYIDLSTTDLPG
jgi:hypothetical protein